jgi:LysR family carnitine catabolism transcriptional activator
MMEFSSRQLRAFLLVAKHRKFSRAAEALFITPSGLSVMIRELEMQVGFRLFDRTSRHVALTRHGNELLFVAQSCLEQFDTAVLRISRSATHSSRMLSLGATPLVAADILPEAIKEFRRHRPDLRIHLYDGDRSTLMHRVQSGKLDLALGAFFETAVGIRRTPFFRFSLIAIRADDDPAFRPASIAWSALKGNTLISLPPTNPTQRLIDRNLAQAGVSFEHRMAVNYLETLIAMVLAGEGLAVIPSFAIPACRDRKVVVSRLTNPVVNLDFYQISSRARRLPPGADDLTSFLKSFIARWAGPAGVL